MEEKVRERQAQFELRELTLGQVLDQTVARIPDNDAVVYPDRNYRQTWREFGALVDDFAKGLMAMDIPQLQGLMGKIGVGQETLTTAPYKDAGSYMRPLSPDQKEYFKRVLEDMGLHAQQHAEALAAQHESPDAAVGRQGQQRLRGVRHHRPDLRVGCRGRAFRRRFEL